ncbi:MAG: nucleotidyltransferase [Fusobacteriaceae bacterium]
MKSTGIIVEYNPFHNGHKHHLEEVKKISGENVIIAIMSGDFVQRGEPASIDKITRAKMALENGVDMVVELPSFYSAQNAEIFALGSVGILNRLKVESLVFGSESHDIEKLEKLAKLAETEKFKEILKLKLKEGKSYPTAYSTAMEELGNSDRALSNDILGLEYIKAKNIINPSIKIKTIKRIKVGYHETKTVENITSATGIRKKILFGEDIEKLVPQATLNNIIGKKMVTLKDFYFLIRYEILNSREKLLNIQDVEEGLEYRLYESAMKNREYQDFFNEVMTKRYTQGRIQRVLIHILLGVTKDLTKEIKKTVPYVRILGFNEKGQSYLKYLKKNYGSEENSITIITSLKNIKKDLSEASRKILETDEKNSEIYRIVSDYKNIKNPLIIRSEEN